MNRFVIHINGSPRYGTMISEMNSQYRDEYEIFEAVTDGHGYKGISMSFKKIIIENYQAPMIHILEDDVKFTSENSRKVFEDILKLLPEKWDIFLGGSYWFELDHATKGYKKVLDFCSLHSVVINKSAYDKILSHDVSIQTNIDRWLGMLSKEKKLNVYLCDPQVAIQHPGHSYNAGKAVDYSSRLKEMNIL